jgi:hypothetical protein
LEYVEGEIKHMRQLQSRPRSRGLLQPVVVSLMFLVATVAPALAQQVTGTLGQADATTTINGKQIPKLTYNLGPSQLSAEDQKKVDDAIARVNN